MLDGRFESRITREQIVRVEAKKLASEAEKIFKKVESKLSDEDEVDELPVDPTCQIKAIRNRSRSGEMLVVVAPAALITGNVSLKADFWFDRQTGYSIGKDNFDIDEAEIFYTLKVPAHLDPLTSKKLEEHLLEHPGYEDTGTEFHITAGGILKTVFIPKSFDHPGEVVDEIEYGRDSDEDSKEVKSEIDLRELEYIVLIIKRFNELIPGSDQNPGDA